MVSLTDRLDMTVVVDWGVNRKSTNQHIITLYSFTEQSDNEEFLSIAKDFYDNAVRAEPNVEVNETNVVTKNDSKDSVVSANTGTQVKINTKMTRKCQKSLVQTKMQSIKKDMLSFV